MGDILMITCPFCGYTTPFPYDIDNHLEKNHSDDSPASPFVVPQDNDMPDTDITRHHSDSRGGKSTANRSGHRRNRPINGSRNSSSRILRTRSPSPPPVPSKPFVSSRPITRGRHDSSNNNSKNYPLSPNPNAHSKRPASDPHPAAAVAPHQHPADDDAGYVECPIDGCGEVIGLSDMDFHLEMHSQEEGLGDADVLVGAASSPSETATLEPRSPMSPTGTSSRPSHSHHSRSNRGSERENKHSGSSSKPSLTSSIRLGERQRKAIHEWKMIFTGSSSASGSKTQRRSQPVASTSSLKAKRLGKAELGKYAHEKKMPEWLVSLLKKGGQVRQAGMIPVIEQLLEQSSFLTTAYLCHPSTNHISKLRREGGFCGYRNMQMLISYIIGARSQGHDHFKDGIPSVFDLQEEIEDAWDKGINSYGRVETGGVRGTRKFIGTPEAQAVLCNLGIQCDVRAFKDKNSEAAPVAMTSLLEEVERYFQSAVQDTTAKVHCTDLPPIYFQHRGHSMTIIGLEKQRVGQFTFTNLLVFDPMFSDAHSLTKLVGLEFRHKDPDKALNSYRRRIQYLQRYHEFEMLRLNPPHLA